MRRSRPPDLVVTRTVELEIPPRAEFLGLTRVVAAAVAAAEDSLDEDRLADLRLVVSEVATNAIEAHWRAAGLDLDVDRDHIDPSTLPPIHLRYWAGADEVVVEVSDQGKGFAMEDVAVLPPAGDPTRLDHERGLGIPLIRLLADEVDFESTSEGTRVRLVVRD